MTTDWNIRDRIDITKMSDDSDGVDRGGTLSQKSDKMFTVKKWNAVAMWSWDVECDTCAICRVQIMDACLRCQAESKHHCGVVGANVTICCTMLYFAVPAAVVHSTYGQVASALCSSVTASAKCLQFTITSPHLCPLKRVTEHYEHGYMWWKKIPAGDEIFRPLRPALRPK